jgi:uncharacterized Zn finger protein
MSKKNKKKMNKILGGKCPECGNMMASVESVNIKDGVKYYTKTIECIECGYVKPYRNKKNNKKFIDE